VEAGQLLLLEEVAPPLLLPPLFQKGDLDD